MAYDISDLDTLTSAYSLEHLLANINLLWGYNLFISQNVETVLNIRARVYLRRGYVDGSSTIWVKKSFKFDVFGSIHFFNLNPDGLSRGANVSLIFFSF